MNEQRKILRVFQLIARLRGPFGCLKEEVARDFEVSTRTVERYFELLSDLGFEVLRQGKAFRIQPGGRTELNAEDLFVFSPEEAGIIRGALLNCVFAGPLQKTILEKLYALTDLDELSESLYKQSAATNISRIRSAIRERRCVVLRTYHSINRDTATDRLVEPIRFYYYYRYLLAYELSSKQVKQFKTERIGGVKISDMPIDHEREYGLQRIDVFGLSGDTSIMVRLRLSRRAALLLGEEFPDASLHMVQHGKQTYFEGPVYQLEGVGRFVMGLLGEVEVVEPEALKNYVKERVEGFLQMT